MASGRTKSGAKVMDVGEMVDAGAATPVPEYEEREVAGVGEFEAECPCCGNVMAFRLFCGGIADETETD